MLKLQFIRAATGVVIAVCAALVVAMLLNPSPQTRQRLLKVAQEVCP